MHLLKKRSMRFYLGFVLILVLAIGGSTIAAFADSPTPNVSVNGQNTISEGTTSVTPASNVTLNGTDQTAAYSMSIPVSDDTGTGNGWYLTITSTPFTSTAAASCAAGPNLQSTNSSTPYQVSTIHSVTSAHNGTGTYTDPNNSISYDLGVPSACTAPTAVVFYENAATHGMGDFKLTAAVNVSILANTFAGTYQSTVTLTLISGHP